MHRHPEPARAVAGARRSLVLAVAGIAFAAGAVPPLAWRAWSNADMTTVDAATPAHHGPASAAAGLEPPAPGNPLDTRMALLRWIPNGPPVPRRGITSDFGWREHPLLGERAFHGGVDLRADTGTPVHATADAVVEWAAPHPRSGLGHLVILRHPFGFHSHYGHLERIGVERGQHLRRGERLGTAGSTGLSTGPHLHYEVRYGQRRLDPGLFLDWSPYRFEQVPAALPEIPWEEYARIVARESRRSAPGQPLEDSATLAELSFPPPAVE